MKICRFVLVGLAFIVLVSIANVDAQDAKEVESELKAAFEGKQLQLKIPYAEDKLQFDSKGELLGKSDIGPWTTFGLIQVSKVTLRNQVLEMTGNRVILVLDTKEGLLVSPQKSKPAPRFVSLITERSMHIALDLPDSTENTVKRSLGQIFQGGDLQSRLAGYWSPEVNVNQEIATMPKGGVIGVLEGKRPVYRAGSGSFQRAKPIYTPDPSYPPEAKREHALGTVVIATVINEQGFPELLAPTHRTIQGFDEKALSAISTWRFEPATMDGKPVAVFVQVEVRFRIN